MIIEYIDTSCDFTDLRIGDAFVFYYDGERNTCMRVNADNYNAVLLGTGRMCKFEPHQKVERVNAKVVIE